MLSLRPLTELFNLQSCEFMDKMPVVTKNLLAINVLAFFAMLAAAKNGIDLDSVLGLHFFMAEDFRLYQLVTYMFMHGGFAHLFFNMFALYMFGRALEYIWGAKRFLLFYLVSGIGAGLLQELVQYVEYETYLSAYQYVNLGYGDPVPMADYLNMLRTVGASGAIYAILLGFGLSFPNEKMFIFPLPVPIKAKYFVVGYALIELALGFSGGSDGVAHFAHLGGMLFGLVLILYWRKKGKIRGPYV